MGGHTGASDAVIAAPLDAVFAAVADIEATPEWQPDVRRLTCLERDAQGRPALVRTEMHTVIRATTSVLRVVYDEPNGVRWTMEEGDVRAFEGGWTLTPLGPSTTRAAYDVRIDFGRKLGLLVRGPAAAALTGAASSSMPGKLAGFVERRLAGG